MKMLIISGLFFNEKGNQSFLNSVKGYLKEYDVTLITAATMESNVYLNSETVMKEVPRVKVISIIPYGLIGIGKKIKDIFSKNKIQVNEQDSNNSALVNLLPTLSSYVSFYGRSILLFIFSFFYCIYYRPNIICCYEINGVRASNLLKKIFNIPVFVKYQGTALGGSLNKLAEKETRKIFGIDIQEVIVGQNFDGAIMTNDGTSGDQVLDYYNYLPDRVLFLNNGIEPKFTSNKIQSRAGLSFKNNEIEKEIKLIVVSRLTPWKRVDSVLRGIAEFKKNDKRKISLNLIGVGSKQEVSKYLELIDNLDLKDEVIFTKGAKIEDIIEFVMDADLLVSVNKFTNVSNPVFEALYLNTPVLTIFQQELCSVIGPGKNSCIFISDEEVKDLPASISYKLSQLNGKEYNKLCNSHTAFLEHFPTWEKRSDKELKFIGNLI